MIYEFPEADAPIRQGDIFKIPQIHYDPAQLLVVEDGKVPNKTFNWQEFVDKDVRVVARITTVFGIVATQDCDTQRDDFIALFEIDKFLNIKQETVNQKDPLTWWVRMITRNARAEDKWFYLPPNEKIGFVDKMAADFQTIIPVPTDFMVTSLSQLRLGRWNYEADEHFREKIAHYFRRYPYDEWYPLSKEEFENYKQQPSREDTKPFPWQE